MAKEASNKKTQEEIVKEFLQSKAERLESYFTEIEKEKVMPWSSPAFSALFMNPSSKVKYVFVNQLLLYFESESRKFTSNKFITINQGNKENLQLTKSSKASYVLQNFAMKIGSKMKKDPKTGQWMKDSEGKYIPERDENGEVIGIYKRFQKLQPVFNLSLFEGEIPNKWKDKKQFTCNSENINKITDAIIAAVDVNVVRHLSSSNYYSLKNDEITLSNRDLFKNDVTELHVLLHEICHSTGHEKRMKRESLERYHELENGKEYFRAYEELCVNLAAQALVHKYGLDPQEYNNSFGDNNGFVYDVSWTKQLIDKHGVKIIFDAAQDAEKIFHHVDNEIEPSLILLPEFKEYFTQEKKEREEAKEQAKSDFEESQKQKATTKKKSVYKRK